MQRTLSAFFLSLAAALLVAVPSVRAESSSTVQKAIETVRETLDALVTTKDQARVNDVALRTETYLKVLDLAAAEIKELKVRLLALDLPKDDGALAAWRDAIVGALGDAADHCTAEAALIDAESRTMTVDRIKQLAEGFKTWREGEYLGIAGQARDYLLVDQQSKTLLTASRRLENVGKDVAKIRAAKMKGSEKLTGLLGEAGESIAAAGTLNKTAYALFRERYAVLFEAGTSTATSSTTGATSTASSTESEEGASSTEPGTAPEETSATTTPAAATTTPSEASSSEALPPSPPSIKELVKESLVKTKEAYRVFIEMSNFVRELLA